MMSTRLCVLVCLIELYILCLKAQKVKIPSSVLFQVPKGLCAWLEFIRETEQLEENPGEDFYFVPLVMCSDEK